MASLTVGHIQQQHPDEWVLLAITRDDKDPRRVAGRVLAHSRDRAALDAPYHRFRAEQPRARVYEFFTGALVAEGVTAVL